MEQPSLAEILASVPPQSQSLLNQKITDACWQQLQLTDKLLTLDRHQQYGTQGTTEQDIEEQDIEEQG